MIHRSIDESAGHFWWSAEFENMANTDFENLKHLENPGHLFLTEPIISTKLPTSAFNTIWYFTLLLSMA